MALSPHTCDAPLPGGSPSDPAPAVLAIVLNWNGWQRTIECLRSLETLRYPCVETLVVDNGSTDESVARLMEHVPRVSVLPIGRNLGFAAGSNAGLRRACATGADYAWLLNNDTRVAPDALSTLVGRASRDPGVGAVGSTLLEKAAGTQALPHAGGSVSFWSGLPRHRHGDVHEARLHYLRATSLLLRCAALRQVGVLDSGFFLYWEDTDLCFRLRDAGWRLAVAPDSMVAHRGYGSMPLRSPGWDYHFTASSVRFFRRHARFPAVPIAVGTGGRLLNRALHGRWTNVHAVWRGLRAAAAPPDRHRKTDSGVATVAPSAR